MVDPKTGLFAGGSGSGMIITVFVVWKVFQLTGLQSFEKPGLTTLASRDALCYSPLPCFLVKIFYLAWIIGETG